jgi:hypothetical protein
MSPSVAELCASLHRVATSRASSSGAPGLQPMSRGHFIICWGSESGVCAKTTIF